MIPLDASAAPALALVSAVGFGCGLITARIGLRSMDARAGAAWSIPTAGVLLLAASPFALDLSGFSIVAALVFASVGLFFPAAVTLLTFRSTALLGPTITGTVSSAAPLVALVAAWLLLDEAAPGRAVGAAVGVVVGIVLLTWQAGAARPLRAGLALAWPLAGAVLRGLAQVGVKVGLVLWPHPFAATLIGYLMSSAVVRGVDHLRGGRARAGDRAGVPWFMLTGACNGAALLLLVHALALAPVWQVAPIVAVYPLVTALLSALWLPDERLTPRGWAGAAITVAAIAWLMAAPRP